MASSPEKKPPERLGAVGILSSVEDSSLQKTSRFAKLKSVSAGNPLLSEKKRTDTLYILISGKLLVSQGGRSLLRITEPGSYIGETYALLDIPCSITVEAETDCVVIPIPISRLNSFFQQVPEQAHRLARILAQRLLDSYGEIQRLRQELEQSAKLGMSILTTYKEFSKGATREQLNQRLEYWVSEVKKMSALQQKIVQ